MENWWRLREKKRRWVAGLGGRWGGFKSAWRGKSSGALAANAASQETRQRQEEKVGLSRFSSSRQPPGLFTFRCDEGKSFLALTRQVDQTPKFPILLRVRTNPLWKARRIMLIIASPRKSRNNIQKKNTTQASAGAKHRMQTGSSKQRCTARTRLVIHSILTFNTTASPFHPGRCTRAEQTDPNKQQDNSRLSRRDMVSQKKKNRRAGPTWKKRTRTQKEKTKGKSDLNAPKNKSPPSDWHRVHVFSHLITSSITIIQPH